jgi:hypothetical protein
MLIADQKQKIIRAVRNESKLALGVVLKFAAALLVLEVLVQVVTAAGLRMNGASFPWGASPPAPPPALVQMPPPPPALVQMPPPALVQTPQPSHHGTPKPR